MTTAVRVPGSKSWTQRALILAATARSGCRLVNPSPGEDSRVLAALLRDAGAGITVAEDEEGALGIDVSPPEVLRLPERLFCHDGASQARFLAPFTHWADHPVRMDGSDQLRARPMDELRGALTAAGFTVTAHHGGPGLPLVVEGGFSTASVTCSARTSSQHVSALLLAAPGLPGGLRVTLDGPAVSSTYLQMTLEALRMFGVDVQTAGEVLTVGPCTFDGREVELPPDWSLVPFPAIAAHLTGLPWELPTEGREVALFPPLWERFLFGESTLDLKADPDLLPPLAVAAALLDRPVTFRGIGHAAHKESDRVAVLARELAKVGVQVEVGPGTLAITRCAPGSRDATLSGDGDHRMVMALALLGLRHRVTVAGHAAVAKSWPDYFEDMRAVGL